MYNRLILYNFHTSRKYWSLYKRDSVNKRVFDIDQYSEQLGKKNYRIRTYRCDDLRSDYSKLKYKDLTEELLDIIDE
jgi:hypothetical protein